MNSLGCIFKNIGDPSVGEIIDKKWKLKGLSIGDAKISEKHIMVEGEEENPLTEDIDNA